MKERFGENQNSGKKETREFFPAEKEEGVIGNEEKIKLEYGDARKLEEARKRMKSRELETESESEEQKKERIREYIEKNIPNYLTDDEPSKVYRLVKKISSFFVKEVIGKESLPKGPKLFIANHRGGEAGRLMAAVDDPIHIAAAETINWEGRKLYSWALRWLLKKLEMVAIRETFSNLNKDQQGEVVERSSAIERKLHQRVIEGRKGIGGGNVQNVRSMTALLLRGDNVAIMAEGPFSRLDNDEKKSYAGYSLVAREYKKITGEDLNIVPTGIRNNKVFFGESFHIDKDDKQQKEELQEIATQKIHSLYKSLE